MYIIYIYIYIHRVGAASAAATPRGAPVAAWDRSHRSLRPSRRQHHIGFVGSSCEFRKCATSVNVRLLRLQKDLRTGSISRDVVIFTSELCMHRSGAVAEVARLYLSIDLSIYLIYIYIYMYMYIYIYTHLQKTLLQRRGPMGSLASKAPNIGGCEFPLPALRAQKWHV